MSDNALTVQDQNEETGVFFQTVIGKTAKPLTEILMENIQKVQENPEYIAQAKEIRDNVRELVNLARVEADMVRELRKTQK